MFTTYVIHTPLINNNSDRERDGERDQTLYMSNQCGVTRMEQSHKQKYTKIHKRKEKFYFTSAWFREVLKFSVANFGK